MPHRWLMAVVRAVVMVIVMNKKISMKLLAELC